MMKRFISLLLGAAMIFAPISMSEAQGVNAADRSYSSATDLLAKGSAACKAEQGMVKITLKTFAVTEVSEIGFLDVNIEYTDDGNSWTVECGLGDMKNKPESSANTRSVIDGYAVQVEGGHYYRVTCEHYVIGYSLTEKTMAQQTAHDYSRAVWVPRAVQTTVTSPPAEEAMTTVTTAAQTIAYVSSVTTTVSAAASTATAKSTAAPAATTTVGGAVSAQSTAAPKSGETSSPVTGGKPPVIPLATAAVSCAVLLTLRKKQK